MEVFHAGGVPLLDWRENLEFDGQGTLWVSHLNDNQVEGYGPDGKLRVTVAVPAPGGIRRGVDGKMYVNYGIGVTATYTGIKSFDPAAEKPVAETFVDGLSGIKGLAIDGAGNFYLGRELSPSILKLRPDGTPDDAWTAAADVFGTNGVSIKGGTLYAAVLTDLTSPVERVPLDDPGAHNPVAKLSQPPVLYKGLDDLEAVGDQIYVTAYLSGELLRVDQATGKACVLVSGLQFPTSVRVPVGFGEHDPARELFVSEASGRIVQITVS